MEVQQFLLKLHQGLEIGQVVKGRVTGMGIASVAHQVTIRSATAATNHALSESPLGVGSKITLKKRNIPNQKPLFLIAID